MRQSQRNMGRLIALISVLSVARMAPLLCRQGMFFDGLDYASISRNLALGRGTAWQTNYSQTLFSVFYEHPPLLFWLQSLFFRFSESFFVEKIFSAAVFVLTLVLLLRLVGMLLPKKHDAAVLVTACSVLPWVLYSTTAFVHSNNMLEGLMGLFALAATLVLIAEAQSRKRLIRGLCLATGALLIVAAVLTKGIPGFFPIVVPFAYRLCITRARLWRGLFVSGLVLVCVAGGLALLFWTQADARDFLQHYWSQQVMGSISGALSSGQQPNPPLTLLIYLLDIMLPSLILLGAVLIGRRRKAEVWREFLPAALFMGFVALCASLPIAVSHRLSRYYLAPSMLFYAPALGFAAVALWPSDPATVMLKKRGWQRVCVAMAATVVLLVAWLSLTWGTPRRDEACFELMSLLRDEEVWDETVEVSPSLDSEWALRCYMQRYLRISVKVCPQPTQAVYLILAAEQDAAPAGYVPVKTPPTGKYQLLRRLP